MLKEIKNSGKRCSKCHEVKEISCFNRRYERDRNGLKAFLSACKDCNKKKVYSWRMKNISKMRRIERSRSLKRNHGITVEEYKKMVDNQFGLCGICKNLPSPHSHNGSLVVDHDHKTGRLRGLLCAKCNTAIGMMGDDPEIVRSAFEYLSFTQPMEELP